MPQKRDKPIDWAGIEKDYLAGVMSVREMARWYGVDEKSIRKKASAEGWARSSKPRHVKPERLPALEGEVLPPIRGAKPDELGDRGRAIAARLMDELEAVTAHAGELEDMICTEESDPRRRQALLKAISLGDRATTLKNLSTALKTLNEAAAPQGKKAERQTNADRAASAGRFSVPAGPKMVVDNTR